MPVKFLFPGGVCTSVGFRHGNSERSSGLPAFVGHVTPVSWFLCVCLGCGLGARAGDDESACGAGKEGSRVAGAPVAG